MSQTTTKFAQLDRLIDAHLHWKRLFEHAVESGQYPMRVSVVEETCHCELGQWLRDVAEEFNDNIHWQNATRLHDEYHQACSQLVTQMMLGNKEAVMQALAQESDLAVTSAQLVYELVRWRRISAD